MKKFFTFLFLINFSLLAIFALPVSVYATETVYEYDGIVPRCNVTGDTKDGAFNVPCNFEALMALINKVIYFLLVYFATPLAAIIFAYAGFLLIFSSANEHNKSKAKSIIGKVILGYVIALAAWLIINTILTTFGFNDAYSLLK